MDDISISIIIPCYNHGQYIDDALSGLKEINGIKYEIIIVNDGSTDIDTINKLTILSSEGYTVVNKHNEGLGKSRNYGISISKGKYILPLDSDNKVKAEYIYEALSILEKDEADIVYAKPSFFGDKIESRQFTTNDFNIYKLLNNNFIDACAVYRKSVWKKNNGYETNMPYPGHEDWEFWINSYVNGFKFKFIDKELYEYRIVENSMIAQTIYIDKNLENFKFILNKHFKLYRNVIDDLAQYKLRVVTEEKNPLRTSIKYILKFLRLMK